MSIEKLETKSGLGVAIATMLRNRAVGRAAFVMAPPPFSDVDTWPPLDVAPFDAADDVALSGETPDLACGGTGDLNDPGDAIYISYRDAEGSVSARRITLEDAWVDEAGEIHLTAFCHESGDEAAFAASRIDQVVDMDAGEKFENARGFLRSRVLFDRKLGDAHAATGDALRRFADAITLLVFFARANGRLDREEITAIVDYLAYVNRDHAPFDDALMVQKLRRLRPSEKTFHRALDRIAMAHESEILALLRGISRVIHADGAVKPEERELIAELNEVLEASGHLGHLDVERQDESVFLASPGL